MALEPVGPVYLSPRLEALRVPHAFTTRIGAQPDRQRFTFAPGSGLSPPVDTGEVASRAAVLTGALTTRPHKWVAVHQIHGAHVEVVDEAPPAGTQADALVTGKRGLMLAIRVADCLPLLLAARDGSAVAAVHAGWRGVVAGIVPNTVRALASRFGVAPENLTAAIGPCIRTERFEVGPEVADRFRDAGLAASIVERPDAKPHIDLAAAVCQQLTGLGVERAAIDLTDRCTFRDADEFFSHRREGAAAGRMAAVIARPET